MEIFPPVKVTRFEQLKPGDLFIYPDKRQSCFAIKVEKQSADDSSGMVVLGPNFPDGISESFILEWQPATVISFGKEYSILLPQAPDLWFLSGSLREPVCIAVCEQRAYVCANGGSNEQRFLQCFVEFSTGKLVERQLPGHVAYTNNWEIVISHQNLTTQPLIKYRGKADREKAR